MRWALLLITVGFGGAVVGYQVGCLMTQIKFLKESAGHLRREAMRQGGTNGAHAPMR